MEEIEFDGSYILHTLDAEPAPFEIIIDGKYLGNQGLSNEQAKTIADFIYKKLGITPVSE